MAEYVLRRSSPPPRASFSVHTPSCQTPRCCSRGHRPPSARVLPTSAEAMSMQALDFSLCVAALLCVSPSLLQSNEMDKLYRDDKAVHQLAHKWICICMASQPLPSIRQFSIKQISWYRLWWFHCIVIWWFKLPFYGDTESSISMYLLLYLFLFHSNACKNHLGNIIMWLPCHFMMTLATRFHSDEIQFTIISINGLIVRLIDPLELIFHFIKDNQLSLPYIYTRFYIWNMAFVRVHERTPAGLEHRQPVVY